jgi:hypothetical protein
VSSWPEIPPQDGLIRLSEPAAFNLEPTVLRWFSVDVLAGLYDPDLPENGIRLPVAPHFDLLISATTSSWSRIHGSS